MTGLGSLARIIAGFLIGVGASLAIAGEHWITRTAGALVLLGVVIVAIYYAGNTGLAPEDEELFITSDAHRAVRERLDATRRTLKANEPPGVRAPDGSGIRAAADSPRTGNVPRGGHW